MSGAPLRVAACRNDCYWREAAVHKQRASRDRLGTSRRLSSPNWPENRQTYTVRHGCVLALTGRMVRVAVRALPGHIKHRQRARSQNPAGSAALGTTPAWPEFCVLSLPSARGQRPNQGSDIENLAARDCVRFQLVLISALAASDHCGYRPKQTNKRRKRV